MNKFGFNIRTQTGHKVDNIVIMARDMDEAERRLRQMYTKCVIVGTHEAPGDPRRHPRNVKRNRTHLPTHFSSQDRHPVTTGAAPDGLRGVR